MLQKIFALPPGQLTVLAAIIAASTALIVALINGVMSGWNGRRLDRQQALRAYRLERLKPLREFIDLRETEYFAIPESLQGNLATGAYHVPAFTRYPNLSRVFFPYSRLPDAFRTAIELMLESEAAYWKAQDDLTKFQEATELIERSDFVRYAMERHVFGPVGLLAKYRENLALRGLKRSLQKRVDDFNKQHRVGWG